MQPYKITHNYGIYYARWQNITVEAETHHEAIIRIMEVIKEVVCQDQ